MAQRCYARISDTGLHCAWCVTRETSEGLSQTFCEKHGKSCEEMGYYCSDFIGYKPDWRMSDKEEQKLLRRLRYKND